MHTQCLDAQCLHEFKECLREEDGTRRAPTRNAAEAHSGATTENYKISKTTSASMHSTYYFSPLPPCLPPVAFATLCHDFRDSQQPRRRMGKAL